MLIRTAAPTDTDAITGLAVSFFMEDAGAQDPHTDTSWPARDGSRYYGRAISDPTANVLVAESAAHEMIGFLVGRQRPLNPLRPDVTVAELESMFVQLDHRSLGVGQQLVEAFGAWAHDRAVTHLTVTAFARNDGARHFYERLGFIAHAVTFEAAVCSGGVER